jgi:protein-S-isoprenylcysteine O-methyltransferase Ste14
MTNRLMLVLFLLLAAVILFVIAVVVSVATPPVWLTLGASSWSYIGLAVLALALFVRLWPPNRAGDRSGT